MRVARVVAMHVADENDVDLAQPRIGRTGDRATGVVKNARAVRILKDQRAVLRAQLAVLTAKRRHFHLGRQQLTAQSLRSSIRRLPTRALISFSYWPPD